jgi:isopentenyl-diphosphate delta-isomerase
VGLRALGVRLMLPGFRYRAVMPNGVVENEMCPVFVASSSDDLALNPDEVDDASWVDWARFRAGVLDGSREISPWCHQQVELLPEDPLTARGPSLSALPPAARAGAVTGP